MKRSWFNNNDMGRKYVLESEEIEAIVVAPNLMQVPRASKGSPVSAVLRIRPLATLIFIPD